MKWIALGTLAGWAGIFWLALKNAGARLDHCTQPFALCGEAARASLDNTEIVGLSIGLVIAVGFALAGAFDGKWISRRGPAPREATQAQRTRRLP